MSMSSILCVVLSLAIQTANQDMTHRGAAVMGFDQQATTHHFYLYEDGGAIVVRVRDGSNAKDRDAIRSHLRHVAAMFAAGDFEAPMLVHATDAVPGTGVLAARRAMLTYKYVEAADGGRVEIFSRDREALAALHEFLTFQIQDHRTGDPTTVSKRP